MLSTFGDSLRSCRRQWLFRAGAPAKPPDQHWDTTATGRGQSALPRLDPPGLMEGSRRAARPRVPPAALLVQEAAAVAVGLTSGLTARRPRAPPPAARGCAWRAARPRGPRRPRRPRRPRSRAPPASSPPTTSAPPGAGARPRPPAPGRPGRRPGRAAAPQGCGPARTPRSAWQSPSACPAASRAWAAAAPRRPPRSPRGRRPSWPGAPAGSGRPSCRSGAAPGRCRGAAR
mmetsp:Transcript_75668/g.244834  ORF Transcript_75668/g.244834 Transcript_75668/m.244834 type:complete len:231 (-) Transcript_75668:492-1184(-)